MRKKLIFSLLLAAFLSNKESLLEKEFLLLAFYKECSLLYHGSVSRFFFSFPFSLFFVFFVFFYKYLRFRITEIRVSFNDMVALFGRIDSSGCEW